MSIISMLIGFVFLVPILINDTRYTVDTYSEYTESLNLLYISIQKDISKDYALVIEEDNETLFINNVKYSFIEDGVYRVNDEMRQRLTHQKVNYELDGETIRIFTDKDSNNNKIDLKFNLDYTSIQKRRK